MEIDGYRLLLKTKESEWLKEFLKNGKSVRNNCDETTGRKSCVSSRSPQVKGTPTNSAKESSLVWAREKSTVMSFSFFFLVQLKMVGGCWMMYLFLLNEFRKVTLL